MKAYILRFERFSGNEMVDGVYLSKESAIELGEHLLARKFIYHYSIEETELVDAYEDEN